MGAMTIMKMGAMTIMNNRNVGIEDDFSEINSDENYLEVSIEDEMPEIEIDDEIPAITIDEDITDKGNTGISTNKKKLNTKQMREQQQKFAVAHFCLYGLSDFLDIKQKDGV